MGKPILMYTRVKIRLSHAAGAALGLAAVLPTQAAAHGIPVQAKDLPVPLSWFYWGAGVILLASFVLLGGLWSKPLLARQPWKALPAWLGRIVDAAPLRWLIRGLMLACTGVVLVAATFGKTEIGDNIAPIALFIGFWLILLPMSVVIGDIWGWSHPAATLARLGGVEEHRTTERQPGLWWAAAGIWAFAWLELVYPTATHVRLIGVLIALWLLATVWQMSRVGISQCLRSYEPFAVYSRLLGRMSMFARRDGRLGVRPPVVGALDEPPVPGLALMCVLLVGTVSYDGLSRTRWWSVQVADATQRATDLGLSVFNARLIFGTFGMVAMSAIAYGAFEAACWAAARLGGMKAPAAGRIVGHFAPTLLPIAMAYVIAHYASFVVTQGQGLLILASDPFGAGWNLFGTDHNRVHYNLIAPAGIWFIQVGAIAIGHVLGLVLAHERALALTSSRRAAVMSQIAMLALMVLYTVGGLYFLSEGMT